ncbi:hypothetical protein DICPUDRAFT_74510 [Dictyostelium purpureum]|uniref:Cytochrome P450 family protein n=1 Tax=Dictyostelium purpureum TaxID=5786 RepID=F0Z7Y5_DICPU|nr:uncharacterized protein DICPUDRAFT_74510 [Dictyostelium purpureum]EGC39927.1 hypothetical protein DICPUDRAFT_74510 [Dictyostelium purpureum]|eukprot:XP_003283556.1 hypothetical protein DICPUDRAFT_74510 [Dictyostelium purpureum]
MNYLFIILFISIIFFIVKTKKESCTIPGPKGKLIFGNLLDLKGGDIHLKFQEWYYKYGPIYKIKMGSVETVVLTEYPTIKEAFVDNSLIFMQRYQRPSRRVISNWEDLINSNTEMHTHLKKIVISELTMSKLKKMEINLKDEAKRLCSLLDKHAESGETFKINNYIKMFSMNVILRFLFGVTFPYNHLEDGIGLIGVVKNVFESAALPIVSDFIPMLAPLSKKQIDKVKYCTDQLGDHIKEQVEIYKKRKMINDTFEKEDENTTILDKLLKDFEAGEINENNFIGTMIGLMTAGIDTSANTIIFSIIELTNHEKYQEELYSEIRNSVSESDQSSDEGISYSEYKSSIPYLTNVIKETFRKYPAALLGLPHITSQDCEIGGHTIKKGTQVIQNIYATHRNKNVWEEPDRFIPSRFEKEFSTDKNLIHFALGRRSCPGNTLADSEIFTCLATLFKKYKFTNTSPTPLNEVGKFGVSYIAPPTVVKVEKRY